MRTLRVDTRIKLDPGLEWVSVETENGQERFEPDCVDLEVRADPRTGEIKQTILIFGTVDYPGAAVFSDEIFSCARPLQEAPEWALAMIGVIIEEFQAGC